MTHIRFEDDAEEWDGWIPYCDTMKARDISDSFEDEWGTWWVLPSAPRQKSLYGKGDVDEICQRLDQTPVSQKELRKCARKALRMNRADVLDAVLPRVHVNTRTVQCALHTSNIELIEKVVHTWARQMARQQIHEEKEALMTRYRAVLTSMADLQSTMDSIL